MQFLRSDVEKVRQEDWVPEALRCFQRLLRSSLTLWKRCGESARVVLALGGSQRLPESLEAMWRKCASSTGSQGLSEAPREPGSDVGKVRE